MNKTLIFMAVLFLFLIGGTLRQYPLIKCSDNSSLKVNFLISLRSQQSFLDKLFGKPLSIFVKLNNGTVVPLDCSLGKSIFGIGGIWRFN